MFYGLTRQNPLSVVVEKHLAEQVKSIFIAVGLILGLYELIPRFNGHSK